MNNFLIKCNTSNQFGIMHAAVAFGITIMVMQWLSNGSVCDGCLYNAGQGFRNLTYYVSKGKINFSWRKVTMIIMIVGAAVAVSNLITNIVPWMAYMDGAYCILRITCSKYVISNKLIF